jgi:hypothetical protein
VTLECVFREWTTGKSEVFEHEHDHWALLISYRAPEMTGVDVDLLPSSRSFFHFSHLSQSFARV